MDHFSREFTRRRFLAGLGTVAASMLVVPAFAEERLRWIESGDFADDLARTPAQTEGPFYPDHLPLDKDNDLIIVGKGTTPAAGEVTHLTGRIVDVHGQPIKDATIEIWQADNHGV